MSEVGPCGSCCCSCVDELLLCCISDVVLSLRVQLEGFCGFRDSRLAGAQLNSQSLGTVLASVRFLLDRMMISGYLSRSTVVVRLLPNLGREYSA